MWVKTSSKIRPYSGVNNSNNDLIFQTLSRKEETSPSLKTLLCFPVFKVDPAEARVAQEVPLRPVGRLPHRLGRVGGCYS